MKDVHAKPNLKDIDIWLFQESSMNAVAHSYNTRNNDIEGSRCFYNQHNECDHIFMMSTRMSAGAKHIKKEDTTPCFCAATTSSANSASRQVGGSTRTSRTNPGSQSPGMGHRGGASGAG